MRNLFFFFLLLLVNGLAGCGVVKDIAINSCSNGSYNNAVCPNLLDRMVPKASAVETSPEGEIKCRVEVKTWRQGNVLLQESTRTCKPEEAGVDQVLPGLALLFLLGFWLRGDQGLGYKAQVKSQAKEGVKALPWLGAVMVGAIVVLALTLALTSVLQSEGAGEEVLPEEQMCSEWREGTGRITVPCWVLYQDQQ